MKYKAQLNNKSGAVALLVFSSLWLAAVASSQDQALELSGGEDLAKSFTALVGQLKKNPALCELELYNDGELIAPLPHSAGQSFLEQLVNYEETLRSLPHGEWYGATLSLLRADDLVSETISYGNLVVKAQLFEMIAIEAIRRSGDHPDLVRDVAIELKKRFFSLATVLNLMPLAYGSDALSSDRNLVVTASIAADRERAAKMESLPDAMRFFTFAAGNPALGEWEDHEDSGSLLDYYENPAPWIMTMAVSINYYRLIMHLAASVDEPDDQQWRSAWEQEFEGVEVEAYIVGDPNSLTVGKASKFF